MKYSGGGSSGSNALGSLIGMLLGNQLQKKQDYDYFMGRSNNMYNKAGYNPNTTPGSAPDGNIQLPQQEVTDTGASPLSTSKPQSQIPSFSQMGIDTNWLGKPQQQDFSNFQTNPYNQPQSLVNSIDPNTFQYKPIGSTNNGVMPPPPQQQQPMGVPRLAPEQAGVPTTAPNVDGDQTAKPVEQPTQTQQTQNPTYPINQFPYEITDTPNKEKLTYRMLGDMYKEAANLSKGGGLFGTGLDKDKLAEMRMEYGNSINNAWDNEKSSFVKTQTDQLDKIMSAEKDPDRRNELIFQRLTKLNNLGMGNLFNYDAARQAYSKNYDFVTQVDENGIKQLIGINKNNPTATPIHVATLGGMTEYERNSLALRGASGGRSGSGRGASTPSMSSLVVTDPKKYMEYQGQWNEFEKLRGITDPATRQQAYKDMGGDGMVDRLAAGLGVNSEDRLNMKLLTRSGGNLMEPIYDEEGNVVNYRQPSQPQDNSGGSSNVGSNQAPVTSSTPDFPYSYGDVPAQQPENSSSFSNWVANLFKHDDDRNNSVLLP